MSGYADTPYSGITVPTLAERQEFRDTITALLAENQRYEKALERIEAELPFTKAKLELQAQTYPDVPLDSCIRDLEHVLSSLGEVLAGDTE